MRYIPSMQVQSASGNFKSGLVSGWEGSEDSWGTKTRDFEQTFKRPRIRPFSVIVLLICLEVWRVFTLTEPISII